MNLLNWFRSLFVGKVQKVPDCEDLGHDVKWRLADEDGNRRHLVKHCLTCDKSSSWISTSYDFGFIVKEPTKTEAQ